MAAERRVWLWTALGTVVLLAAASVGWAVLRRPAPAPSGVAGQPAAGADGLLFAALPARIEAGPDTPDLPADRAVGRAAFIYTVDKPAPMIYLVAVDGTLYRVGTVPDHPEPGAHIGLSPDGRWLVRLRDGRWAVRDLTSRVEHFVDGRKYPKAWSVDGGSMLWDQYVSSEQRSYHVLDTTSGRITDVAFTAGATQSPLVMLSGYELVTVDQTTSSENGTRFSVNVVDVRSGTVLRSIPVDLSAQVRPGERTMGRLYPAKGGSLHLWTNVGVKQTAEPQAIWAVGAVGVDLTSGRILARVDWLLHPTREEVTDLVGAVADGAVLVRLPRERETEISIVSSTGERRVVTRLPGFAGVRPAGEPVG